ncbi:glutamate ABC transporter substrate-binding protein [Yinghuangia soli]|uniref:Glutamate ABC transporter substrate-binding protein n=1 Tax=Yinghuangia soli TaxID=2908204 RepID=A0AA41U037_9ACTN|nr:glutamate ABC transporter substrate-binding protein [Yinghuangia soli]
MIAGSIAVAAVVALVATLIVVLGGDDKKDDAGSAAGPGASSTAPKDATPSGGGKPPSSGAPGPAGSYPVAQGVDLSASPTWGRAEQRGHLIIGAKEDQPSLGIMDPATKERSGFDIEMAKMLSAALGFDPKTIEFKTVASANREAALQRGDIDFYIGTYSITEKRKETVDFAGPYYVSGQSLLVKKNDTSITGKDTIKGKKVCSAKGSTPAQKIKVEYPDSTLVEYDTYSQCVDSLLTGQVDALTTDESILKGYAARDPGLKVVGEPFTTEKYGIGLGKGDTALRTALNDAVDRALKDGTWQQIYQATLGKAAAPPPLTPVVERY